MKISVVVPTYQRPHLLLRCVEAISRQDFLSSDYEIVIVSDGPGRESQAAIETIKKDGPVIRFLELPVKQGPAAARNFGWRSSHAHLIVFTDDDCIADTQWLSGFWNCCTKTKINVAAFSGKTIVPISDKPTDYERNISHLSTAEFITANCACTLEALLKVGGFDEAFTMAWREDSALQFKFIENNIPIINVPAAIVTHPVRKATWGISIKDEAKGMFNALLYKKFPSLYAQRIESGPPTMYYLMVASILLCLIAIVASAPISAWAGFALWVVLTLAFTVRRLKNTVHSFRHILEMLFTSMVIPFLSLYYRIYGAIKFRSPLIP
jgi:glycosyltransferase involved in cell wall biosynthesis